MNGAMKVDDDQHVDGGRRRQCVEEKEESRICGCPEVSECDDGEVSGCEEQTSWLQHDVTELVNVGMAKMGWNGEHEAEREATSDGSKGGGAGDGVTGGVGDVSDASDLDKKFADRAFRAADRDSGGFIDVEEFAVWYSSFCFAEEAWGRTDREGERVCVCMHISMYLRL
eukprot:s2429_g1.t1